MNYIKLIPQTLLVLFFTKMLVTTLKAYLNHKSFKTLSDLQNLVIGLTFIVLMLVWGGFFNLNN